MTVGIAAYGLEAGRAVLEGVLATEVLGRGSIGGFVVFSVLDEHGQHQQVSLQCGGITALDDFDLRPGVRCAAAISSGPNRPEPLSQFLAGRDGLGLVTGHRLPQRIGSSGLPLNSSALERMAQGHAPHEAVQSETKENPEADFGLIAVAADGKIGFGNSARVQRRVDLLEVSRLEKEAGFAMLGNSIYFNNACRDHVAIGDLIWSRLTGSSSKNFIAKLGRPAPVSVSEEDWIEIDDDGGVLGIGRADPWWPAAEGITSVVYSGMPVWRNSSLAGTCLTEVFATLGNGLATPHASHQYHFAVRRS
ncbi:DUF6963 family protein [Pseudooceanicola batsensis]|uniref:DUF6963 family protein n=1 Tax=Pseudooceanicola batsensis TaxID=314255 RepID=UPI00067FC410|nr:hypothetical protein [Pseudooceanicola batsensis]